jgi:two-component system nitrate/nitrite response regulator NarL
MLNSVAVCDTEPIAIEGLRSLLESAEKLRVVATGTSLADGMAAVEEYRPAVLLLDKSFGMQAVIDWMKTLQTASFRTAVVVWSRLITESEALRFLQGGAAGVVRKTASLETLLSCLDTVTSGATWMENEMIPGNDRSVRYLRSPLTARELQVMDLVERGLRNKDIAQELGIRTGTVKIHLKHIFEKTGIRGRYGLALSGLKEKGLLAQPVISNVAN